MKQVVPSAIAGRNAETPERDLSRLLQFMAPKLHSDVFAFCELGDVICPPGLHALAMFREDEGLTVVVPRAAAVSHGWHVAFEAALITLRVHSDLEAVGLLACVSAELVHAGVPCNVMSAVYHDHLFVPIALGEQALATLHALSRQAVQGGPHVIAN